VRGERIAGKLKDLKIKKIKDGYEKVDSGGG
jgi:hypothetical protein